MEAILPPRILQNHLLMFLEAIKASGKFFRIYRRVQDFHRENDDRRTATFVRFTVQVQKGSAGLHSYFVTDINEYKNTANSLSVPNLLRPRGTVSGVVDAKLQNFLQPPNKSPRIPQKLLTRTASRQP